MENINKKFLKKDAFNALVNGQIPKEEFGPFFHEFINDFNNIDDKDFFAFFDKHKELIAYDSYFYEDVLSEVKEFIRETYNDYYNLKSDFDYFIKRFWSDFDLISSELNKEITTCRKFHKESVKNSYFDDISHGIFSTEEANSRKVFFEIQGPNLSEKCKTLQRELKFHVDMFYSYLYIKCEQILFFHYNLFKNKENEKLYLMNKYNFYIKNNFFSLNMDKKQEKIDYLNRVWKFFKHQEELSDEHKNEIYLRNNIEKHILFILEIYVSFSSILKLEDLWNKINLYYEYIDEWLNPLGLTGFE